VYESAKAAVVRDVDGNQYIDLTAGFAVALLGHGHPAVVTAIEAQCNTLIHALGDVYPSARKIEFERALAECAPWPEAKVILGLSGADAVEAALKTAVLATSRATVVAFEGAYHGLAHGPLAACGYSAKFREPFAGQLNANVTFLPYPDEDDHDAQARCVRALELLLSHTPIGALLIEPILGRGGVRVASCAAVDELAMRVRAQGGVVIADEIYTGLFRTGTHWAYSTAHWRDPADIILWGKTLGGGVPLSACVIKDSVAKCWGNPDGEAIHTSTFLGNPLACAAGLAVVRTLREPHTQTQLAEASERFWRDVIGPLVADPQCGVRRARGRGLLIGLELVGGLPRVLATMRALLYEGYLVLPGGMQGDQLMLTPPGCLTELQRDHCASTLLRVLRRPWL
jgi:4-aminobutyrate aminotransferase/(S)-3-amino-2-methylpropionate transaminase